MERSKAIDVAQRIKDKERHSKAEVIEVLGNNPAGTTEEPQKEFWKLLLKHSEPQQTKPVANKPTANKPGANKSGVKPPASAHKPTSNVKKPGETTKNESNSNSILAADKVSSDQDEDNIDYVKEITMISLENNQVKSHSTLSPQKMSKTILTSDICFILDSYEEFYLWQGKKTSSEQKTAALEQANKLFAKEKRPDFTKMKKILEGTEPILFQEKFIDWGGLPNWSCSTTSCIQTKSRFARI